jgi:hypothetical protein
MFTMLPLFLSVNFGFEYFKRQMLETFETKHKAQHRHQTSRNTRHNTDLTSVETQPKHTTVKQYTRERRPYKTDGVLEGVSIIVLHVFQQYFTCIVAVSFIGGGN